MPRLRGLCPLVVIGGLSVAWFCLWSGIAELWLDALHESFEAMTAHL